MIHKTKGIVLRTVKFGDTSLICTVFTELLGLQSYMVKGVRTAKSAGRRANALFPGAILQMVVYQQPHKSLQIIKEYSPFVIYQNLMQNVVSNSVALFAIEVLLQLIIAHEPDPELYHFSEQFLLDLDAEDDKNIANLPLYFIIQAGKISGYQIAGNYSNVYNHVNLQDGRFASESGVVPPFVSGMEAKLMSRLNNTDSLKQIQEIKMNVQERKAMLAYFLAFIQWHVPHFKELKTLQVLTAIFY